MTYRPKFCKVCAERGQKPKLTEPALAYCREHYNEYQRARRQKEKDDLEEYLRTHNEFGEPINEWGMTEEETEQQIQADLERIEKQYGEG